MNLQEPEAAPRKYQYPEAEGWGLAEMSNLILRAGWFLCSLFQFNTQVAQVEPPPHPRLDRLCPHSRPAGHFHGPWLCGGLGLSMPQVLRGPRGSCVLSTWFFN